MNSDLKSTTPFLYTLGRRSLSSAAVYEEASPSSIFHRSSTTSQCRPPPLVGRGLESAEDARASATSQRLPASSTMTRAWFWVSWAVSRYVSIMSGGGLSSARSGRRHSCRLSTSTSVSPSTMLNCRTSATLQWLRRCPNTRSTKGLKTRRKNSKGEARERVVSFAGSKSKAKRHPVLHVAHHRFDTARART